MIVCEVGLNHLGDDKYSWEYIKKLCETECDSISYQIRENDFYKEEFENFELDLDHYNDIFSYCRDKGKKVGLALAEPNMIDVFDVDFYKVLSWDINNYEFVDKLLSKQKSVYCSTGLATDDKLIDFREKYKDNEFVNLIHTQLSNDTKDVNLKAINEMSKYGFNVGYGNHCNNLNMIFTSLGFEPSDIWFYIKSNKNILHPDDSHAVDLNNVKDLIDNLKELELGIGTGDKIKNNYKAWNKGLENKI